MNNLDKPQIICHIEKSVDYSLFDAKWIPCSANEIINAIDGAGGQSVGYGAPEIVTGSRDGSVKVWDPRQKDRPVAVFEPKEGDSRRDCWSVAFGNSYNSEERVVAAGYDNGDVKMFDLKAMSLRWESNLKNGVCGLEFDRKDIPMNKLVATTLESKFYLFDLRTQHPKRGFAYLTEKAHKSTVWLVKHLPQNREIFMTCGGGGSLCLWKYVLCTELVMVMVNVNINVLVLVRVDKRRSVDRGYCGPVDAAMFPQQRIAPAPKQHRICRFMAQYMLILLVMLMTVVGIDTVKVTLGFKVALEMSSRRGNAEPGIIH
ncbi:hypothetical protein G9C98_004326 [Cotesia typhae]|uniref:WD repeat-containing protein 92 n=1 Tax=Cotesia typhae TaxID=2053667 RepID=A0A8J5R3U2_9HYME|nr:hypothetical protein G9C98_004326 [Cotesia typhae]